MRERERERVNRERGGRRERERERKRYVSLFASVYIFELMALTLSV